MMRSIGRSRGLRALSVLASACALALTAVLSPVAPDLLPATAVDRKVRVSDEEAPLALTTWTRCAPRGTRARA